MSRNPYAHEYPREVRGHLGVATSLPDAFVRHIDKGLGSAEVFAQSFVVGEVITSRAF